MIVTKCNRYPQASPICKQLQWLPVAFCCMYKWPLRFIRFFTVGITTILVFFCLFIVEDMAQDTTVQIKGSWRFLNSTHLYINPKNISATALLLMLPQFGMIYLMMFILPKLLPVSEIKAKSYLFKRLYHLKGSTVQHLCGIDLAISIE